MAALKREIRASPAVQADETGWREDGKNGYIWSVSTPNVRYYEYHHSRGSEVVRQLLGESFEGVLGSDFYASYNIYQGLHQRCWVHLHFTHFGGFAKNLPLTITIGAGMLTKVNFIHTDPH